MSPSIFDLPERLAGKSAPELISADERHFAAMAASMSATIEDLAQRLKRARAAPGGTGQEALDRDQEIHRLTSRLRTLRRFGPDLCLGRIVAADGSDPVYIGRLGLTDEDGRRLLLDWRAPAAEPFFAATHADPMGLVSRRRYRWDHGRIGDYWDEVFTAEALEGHAALDEQSAFIAGLGGGRSERMRDVLGTIQADQDAIIRAGSQGALVVDGGPGTGKTVVALHRAAYLVYADPSVGRHRGGVLFIGPHLPYLAYVSDVLPSLGEDGVHTCTIAALVPESADAADEPDPAVARLKADARMAAAIEPAVGLYERPPTKGMSVESHWSQVWLGAEDWTEAFTSADPGVPHNEARGQVWEELLTILADKHDEVEGVSEELVRDSLRRDRELVSAFSRAWPLIEPTDLIGDLWTVPAYLQMCAPWLRDHEVAALQRERPQAWTTADLPLLDAARMRLGDSDSARRERRREVDAAAVRDRMDDVVTDLLAAQDDNEGAMVMLHGRDLQDALVEGSTVEMADSDRLAGPFGHIMVDEAQELTDAQWQMLLRRCPTRSFTIVGDRAQARRGFAESWADRLQRVGLERINTANLSINYRTPIEVMEEAERAITTALPDANVPTSVRGTGIPVTHGSIAELDSVLDTWLAEHDDGLACVIGGPSFTERPRVRSLSPELAKGLEFDLVVLVDPEAFGDGVEGAVDRYVSMTRATQRLVVLRTSTDHREPLGL